ncbi:MAG: SMP-30/gluconolactonase/LRE family protein [Bryobacteraceae bacterium]
MLSLPVSCDHSAPIQPCPKLAAHNSTRFPPHVPTARSSPQVPKPDRLRSSKQPRQLRLAAYHLDPDGTVGEAKTELGISKTLVWSPDQKKFYFGDTLANTIWAYEYDNQTGTIRKTGDHLANFSRGLPDGSTIDADGFVWNCRWGGSCIVRVAPDREIDLVVEMPMRNITNCTFGGTNFDMLYITTAASPDNKGDRLVGGLFTVRTNTRGIPENRFLLES